MLEGEDVMDDVSVGNQSATLNNTNIISTLNEMDCDKPVEMDDISIEVPRYKKTATTYDTYILFDIITQSSRDEFAEDEYMVMRRYSEFEWLRTRLVESNLMLIVPPLPEKHSITQLERFSGPFMEQRRLALERFLRRVVKHPILSKCEDVFVFLTFDTKDFSQFRSSHATSSGLLAKFTSKFQSSSGRARAPSFTGSEKSDQSDTLKENSPAQPLESSKFEEIYWQVDKFGAMMGRMERVCIRVLEENCDWGTYLGELGDSMMQWGAVEASGTADLIIRGAKGVEVSEQAVTGCTRGMEEDLPQQMHEYVLYADVVKATIQRRQKLHSELMALRHAESQYRKEVDFNPAVGSGPAFSGLLRRTESSEERTQKIHAEIERLSSQRDILKEKLDRASADLEPELIRWDAIRRREVAGLLRRLSDLEVNQYTEIVRGWSLSVESFEPTGRMGPSTSDVTNLQL